MSSTTEPQFEIIRSIRFPPPPPTHNSLTPAQRAQLLRKTRKLEQILGVTPHLLDETSAPVHISFPSNKRSSKPRLSEDSFSIYSSGSSSASSSACSSPTSSYSSSSSINSPLSHRRSGSVSSLSRSPSTTLRKSPPCRDSRDAPRLRLADQLVDERGSQDIAKPTPETPISPSRKTKMDRIRKRLGDDVPVDLVFPEGENTRTNCSRRSSSVESVILVDFPTPRLPRTKKPLGTIAGARNSLVEVNGIHRAPRSSTSSSCSSSSASSSPIEATPPPLPPKSPSALRSSSKNDSLLAIFESPDENISPRSSYVSSRDVTWSASEIAAWSARQACETTKRGSWTYRQNDLVSFIDVGA